MTASAGAQGAVLPSPDDLARWAEVDQRLSHAYRSFDETLGSAWQLTGMLRGQPFASRRHQLAYIGLNKAVIVGTNILSITHPIGDPAVPRRVIQDESSVLSLCRSLLEGFLAFFYLAGEVVSDEEARHRYLVFGVHDAKRRVDLLELLDVPEEERGLDELERRQKELSADPLFQRLPLERQKRLLAGWRTPYELEAVAVRAGIPRDQYRLSYRLFSEYAHVGPISFTRFEQDHRPGAGVAHRRMNIALGLEGADAVLGSMARIYREANPAAAAAFDSDPAGRPRPFWRPATPEKSALRAGPIDYRGAE
jgi:hypothetical protein